MKFIKSLYCRGVQTLFYAAIPFLPYRSPKLFGSVSQLVRFLCAENISSVLLVTDKQLREMGVTAELEDRLRERGVSCIIYDGTCSNPTTENVEQAFELYIKNGCQCLIGFGGGSSIDCAKAVGARVAYPDRPLGKLKGTLRVLRKLPPLAAIPTTAGTGSEVTLAAVITDSETRHKYTINSFPLIPSFAVLDPKVTFSLPPHLTASTGMDALTHAVEAYIGRSTTGQTRSEALEATALIFANLQRAYCDGCDRTARENMLKAAYLAGDAFSKSYVGYIHAVAHSLGGQYNIPHGLANAVLLPIVLEMYGGVIYKKLYRLSVAAGLCEKWVSYRTGALAFIAAVRLLNKSMNIPEKLSGIKKEDIPMMASHADKEANPLYPVPRLMNAKELERIYYRVSAGEPDISE